MFRIIRLKVTLWLIFLLLVSVGTISFRGQRPKLDILHLDKCNLPCWNGIVPSKTTIREAKQIIMADYTSEEYEAISGDGFVEIIARSTKTQIFRVVLSVAQLNPTDNDTISHIQIQFAREFNVRAGDLFVTLDRPQYIVLWGLGGGIFPSLIYENSSVVVSMVTPVAEPLFCANNGELVRTLTIFSQPLPKNYWIRYEPQVWSHFSACFRWNEKFS
jgi:hypothetical protein